MTALRIGTTPLEALSIVAICFGWPITVSLMSMFSGFQNGTFTDDYLWGTVFFELVCGGVAFTVLRVRNYDLKSLYPRPSLGGIAMAAALYFVCVMVGWILAAPFVTSAAQPIEKMMSSASISIPVLVIMALVNATYEEIFLLGFLARGLRKYGTSIAIGVPLLVRVLYHLYQGPLGAIYILVFGLVLSFYYLRTGAIFPVVFADILPFAVR